jgi:hypothetical protein
VYRNGAFRNLWHAVMEHRVMLSLGLSVACGIMLQSFYPIDTADPMLRLIALERPAIFHALAGSYNLFLYSTPFLAISILFSLVYIHLYRGQIERAAGATLFQYKMSLKDRIDSNRR